MPTFKLRKFELERVEAGLRVIRKAALGLRDSKAESKRQEYFKELDAALFSCGDAMAELKK